jgi:hypothetical protein
VRRVVRKIFQSAVFGVPSSGKILIFDLEPEYKNNWEEFRGGRIDFYVGAWKQPWVFRGVLARIPGGDEFAPGKGFEATRDRFCVGAWR